MLTALSLLEGTDGSSSLSSFEYTDYADLNSSVVQLAAEGVEQKQHKQQRRRDQLPLASIYRLFYSAQCWVEEDMRRSAPGAALIF